MSRKIIRSFTMREISGVDRPAQKPATVAIIKRESGKMLYTSLEKGDLPDDVLAYLKREFSAEQRRNAASSGAAESDGSFPIENASDLHNAMRAVGRSKNPEKTKAHIRARARALGLTAELSDAFKRDDRLERMMKVFGDGPQPADIEAAVEKSTTALAESVASIVADKADDQPSLLAKTFTQFSEYMAGLVPNMVKALAAGSAVHKAGSAGGSEGTDDMDKAALKKALGLPDTATDAEVTAELAKHAGLKTTVGKLETDLAIAKAAMSDDEKAYHDGLKDDGEKAAFRGKSKEDRAAAMKKRADLPEDVRKALVENDELKKRVAAMEDKDALAGFTKRAAECGLPEAEGATLQKAYRGDKDALDKVVGFLKAAHAQVKAAGLFKELGDSRDGGGLTAYDELMAKAEELRKKETGLTKEAAFAKVYSDPANADIVKRERAENRPQAA